MTTTVTAEQVRPFIGQVATVTIETRTATGERYTDTLTGVVETLFPEEIEAFGFNVTTGPDEGMGMGLDEVTSITAADPAAARRLRARLALAERHAAEVAEMNARHAAEARALGL